MPPVPPPARLHGARINAIGEPEGNDLHLSPDNQQPTSISVQPSNTSTLCNHLHIVRGRGSAFNAADAQAAKPVCPASRAPSRNGVGKTRPMTCPGANPPESGDQSPKPQTPGNVTAASIDCRTTREHKTVDRSFFHSWLRLSGRCHLSTLAQSHSAGQTAAADPGRLKRNMLPLKTRLQSRPI
jgi:hypothetical protein